jgi:histidine triad (HIT) family protein
MNDCIFCKIIAGEIPAAKIYEDEKVLAFLDINPVNKGHTLIIPKKHHEMMTDTPDDLVAYIFTIAKKLMSVIKKAMAADFICVSVVGIDVPHFHVHLVPRYHNDGLSNFWPTKKYEEGEMEQVAEKIKSSL